MQDSRTDVVVVGAGNAGLCAALSAREAGASVVVLEASPKSQRGGNSAYTGGAMRTVFNGVEDLQKIADIDLAIAERTDFGRYTKENYLDDLATVTEYRCDPELTSILVDESLESLVWMRSQGVRFNTSHGRQAYEVDGRFVFWGGLAVEVNGGGMGLVDSLFDACDRQGVDVRYDHRAVGLLTGDHGVEGVKVTGPDGAFDLSANAVVLAAGGFESNAEWRARYLGPGWDLAKVRGTRYNIGDGIRIAIDAGASPAGHWSGCHAVNWDLNAPEFGDITIGDSFQKYSYPWGIMVNANGERFLDEGADFRNFTYAKYGRQVLAQPGQFAWQIFDSKIIPMLRDEYRIKQVSKVRANTLEELVAKMDGVNPDGFLRTIEEYNEAVLTDIPFDPNVKDGRGTHGLSVPKTNWANRVDDPPFEAYAVTCGITFTFGGVRIDEQTRVLDNGGVPVGNLYSCGEMVGGIFYFNYPGGSGLTAGSVFGRRAGRAAALKS
jgi:tricarballylate dehydrogenase